MRHVVTRQVVNAPVEDVFDRYTDVLSWNDWAGLGSVSVGRAGEPEPYGVGCVRVISTAGWRVEEEVTTFERPRAMGYRLVRGFPLKNHLGTVTFAPSPAGTEVTWSCRFDPTIPGLGGVLRILITWLFARVLRRLAGDVRRGPRGQPQPRTE